MDEQLTPTEQLADPVNSTLTISSQELFDQLINRLGVLVPRINEHARQMGCFGREAGFILLQLQEQKSYKEFSLYKTWESLMAAIDLKKRTVATWITYAKQCRRAELLGRPLPITIDDGLRLQQEENKEQGKYQRPPKKTNEDENGMIINEDVAARERLAQEAEDQILDELDPRRKAMVEGDRRMSELAKQTEARNLQLKEDQSMEPRDNYESGYFTGVQLDGTEVNGFMIVFPPDLDLTYEPLHFMRVWFEANQQRRQPRELLDMLEEAYDDFYAEVSELDVAPGNAQI